MTLAEARTATPRTAPVSPSNSGRDVDAEDRPSARGEIVDAFDAFASQSVDVAGKPGAVKCVDHEVSAVGIERFGGRRDAAVALGRQRGIAAQRLARAQQEKFDAVAALGEQPRRNEAVAAIAARTTEDGDPAAAAGHARGLLGDRRARPLHQDDAGNPAGNRHSVGFAHLGGGQQFGAARGIDHRANVAPHGRDGKGRAVDSKSLLSIEGISAISPPRQPA